MKLSLGVALLGSVAIAMPARAEFQLAPGGLGPALTLRAVPGPVTLLPDGPAPLRKPAAPPVLPLAQGFGHQVPLTFAARQIVPAKVRVTFGPGVDPAALVNWAGGRPWDQALRAAVRPLRLRVVVGWMAVTITRT